MNATTNGTIRTLLGLRYAPRFLKKTIPLYVKYFHGHSHSCCDDTHCVLLHQVRPLLQKKPIQPVPDLLSNIWKALTTTKRALHYSSQYVVRLHILRRCPSLLWNAELQNTKFQIKNNLFEVLELLEIRPYCREATSLKDVLGDNTRINRSLNGGSWHWSLSRLEARPRSG